jgi:hypothetical protein
MSVSLRALTRALLIVAAISVPTMAIRPRVALAQVSVSVSVNVAPPPLPVYDQPPLPAEG